MRSQLSRCNRKYRSKRRPRRLSLLRSRKHRSKEKRINWRSRNSRCNRKSQEQKSTKEIKEPRCRKYLERKEKLTNWKIKERSRKY
jgi:hypothetical protein